MVIKCKKDNSWDQFYLQFQGFVISRTLRTFSRLYEYIFFLIHFQSLIFRRDRVSGDIKTIESAVFIRDHFEISDKQSYPGKCSGNINKRFIFYKIITWISTVKSSKTIRQSKPKSYRKLGETFRTNSAAPFQSNELNTVYSIPELNIIINYAQANEPLWAVYSLKRNPRH